MNNREWGGRSYTTSPVGFQELERLERQRDGGRK